MSNRTAIGNDTAFRLTGIGPPDSLATRRQIGASAVAHRLINNVEAAGVRFPDNLLDTFDALGIAERVALMPGD